jgi:hypothetical protein
MYTFSVKETLYWQILTSSLILIEALLSVQTKLGGWVEV